MDYAAGSLIRSMAWSDDLKAKTLGGNALGWLARRPEDFWR
jgi:hypothetical protein